MGLNLATIGIGFYVAGALAAIAKKASGDTWYPQDLNDGKLENYFFFLAAVMFLNFLVFVFIARKYKCGTVTDKKVSYSAEGNPTVTNEQFNRQHRG